MPSARFRIILLSGLFAALGCGALSDPSQIDAVAPARARDATTFLDVHGPDGGWSPVSAGDEIVRTPELCPPARTSQRLPARRSVVPGNEGVFTRDLFDQFQRHCGACHVEQALGNWKVGWGDFAAKAPLAITAIMSDDKVMPPRSAGGKPWSQRQDDEHDPLRSLVRLLMAWIAAGSPPDLFYPGETMTDPDAASAHAWSRAVGLAMTNLGNCVPDAQLLGSDARRAEALDETFAAAQSLQDLPDRLQDTDLFTLDAALLAASGTVVYAPAYPVWADDARYARMVRVPRGETIRFDAETQSFQIPPNTRFYMTVFKRVIDLDGNASFRKLETRLIVSRPDRQTDHGSEPQALFGTYAWNTQETAATLVRDLQREGAPFGERLVRYVTNEKRAYDLVSLLPPEFEQELSRLARNYAIPSRDRCVECHMGAPNASFILGFTPLQLHRQRLHEQGVIEPAGPDELNQLERLIGYGLFSGLTSPSQVTLLRDSQGSRKPRNEHELEAQAYVLGNCAHCHNPRGFASISVAELPQRFDLQPSESGGIFQFPLELYSPLSLRRGRRLQGVRRRIPYMTPSLYDLGGAAQGYQKLPSSGDPYYVLAPWRSSIYRSVDTPLTYVDDSAIFPHMPHHTPGYDRRARQLLGTWMVSVVSRPKTAEHATAQSDAEPVSSRQTRKESADEEQPFEEVSVGDDDYEYWRRAAEERVAAFSESPRYEAGPSSELDIVDPSLRTGAGNALPETEGEENEQYVYTLAVPRRANWFVTDRTEPPGEWAPRGAGWLGAIGEDERVLPRDEDEAQTWALLDEVRASDEAALREYALRDVPFALWDERGKACEFPPSVRMVASFGAEERPRWMRGIPGHRPAESGHVYTISPGAQVYAQLCQSCHASEADASNRLAATIAELTGGTVRVASLRHGLFGPVPGGTAGAPRNIDRVFGSAPLPRPFDGAEAPSGAVDRAARYLVWMALGGTQQSIPRQLAELVSSNVVLGELRGGTKQLVFGTPNMLDAVKSLCGELLPESSKEFDIDLGAFITPEFSMQTQHTSALIYSNGDAELWEKLCMHDNPLPLRVLTLSTLGTDSYEIELKNEERAQAPRYELFKRSGYPPGPVGDHNGRVQPSLTSLNLAPWCIRAEPSLKDVLDSDWAARHGEGSVPPYCPGAATQESNRLSAEDVEAWKKRGAINAGLSAFYYLDALSRGEKQPTPDFDRCDELRP